MNKISKFCSRCGNIENDEHLFFHYDFSRAVWFHSPMGIKSDCLHGSCAQMLNFLVHNLFSNEQVDLVFYILWFIWKARNDHRFNNKSWSIHSVISQAKAAQKAQYDAYDVEEEICIIGSPNLPCPDRQEYHPFTSLCCCRTDASFHHDSYSGLGVYISDHGNWSLQVQAKTNIADSAIHAEALSLNLGAIICSKLQLANCRFLMDCEPLVSYIHDPSSGLPDWRIRHAVDDTICILNQTKSSVMYIPRAQNVVADSLARNVSAMNPGPDGEGSQVVRVGDRRSRSQCTRKTARRRRGYSEGARARAELPAPKGSRKQLGMFLLNPIFKSLHVFILLSNNNISNNNMIKIK